MMLERLHYSLYGDKLSLGYVLGFFIFEVLGTVPYLLMEPSQELIAFPIRQYGGAYLPFDPAFNPLIFYVLSIGGSFALWPLLISGFCKGKNIAQKEGQRAYTYLSHRYKIYQDWRRIQAIKRVLQDHAISSDIAQLILDFFK